jgi:hypothetical protein
MERTSMKKTQTVDQRCSRVFLVARAVACGVTVLLMSALSISSAADPADSRLKDAEIIAFFRANRDVLERLRQMATEDIAVSGFLNVSKPTIDENPLSLERRNEYRNLLEHLKQAVRVTAGGDEVTFRLEGGGSAIERSWMKGITYLADTRSKRFTVVSSLDNAPKADGVYLVPIEGNWYVAFGIID